MAVDPSLRPIELPQLPAPSFLALAGQDIPPSRKSRPSLGWDYTRGMSQILNEAPAFDYTALRTSMSASSFGTSRQKGQLPTFQPNQYPAIPPPPPFFTQQFAEPGPIKWTNPNPFASSNSNTNSPGHHGGQLPQLGHGDSTSGSSCSAPSPPPELEISPLDPVPGTEPFNMNSMVQAPPISNIPYPMESQEAQPFDLGIFKKSLDLNALTGNPDFNQPQGRPRGMSIFDDLPTGMPASTQPSYLSNHLSYSQHHHPQQQQTQQQQLHPQSLSNMSSMTFSTDFGPTNNDLEYSRALNSSNILAGVPAHEELMEGFA